MQVFPTACSGPTLLLTPNILSLGYNHCLYMDNLSTSVFNPQLSPQLVVVLQSHRSYYLLFPSQCLISIFTQYVKKWNSLSTPPNLVPLLHPLPPRYLPLTVITLKPRGYSRLLYFPQLLLPICAHHEEMMEGVQQTIATRLRKVDLLPNLEGCQDCDKEQILRLFC